MNWENVTAGLHGRGFCSIQREMPASHNSGFACFTLDASDVASVEQVSWRCIDCLLTSVTLYFGVRAKFLSVCGEKEINPLNLTFLSPQRKQLHSTDSQERGASCQVFCGS